MCVCLCVSEVGIELGVSNLVPRFNRLNIAGAGSEPCSAFAVGQKERSRTWLCGHLQHRISKQIN